MIIPQRLNNMTEYIGKDESTLRSLLDESSSFEERRKIRAAIRQLKEGGVRSHSFHVKPTTSSASSHYDWDSNVTSGQFKRPSLGITRTASSRSSSSEVTVPGSVYSRTSQSGGPESSSHSAFSLTRPSGLYSTENSDYSSQLGSKQLKGDLHQPIIKSSRDDYRSSGSLSNIRESLNSAFLKTVSSGNSCPPQRSSSVEFHNGVAKSTSDLSRLQEKYLSGQDNVTNTSHKFNPSYSSSLMSRSSADISKHCPVGSSSNINTRLPLSSAVVKPDIIEDHHVGSRSNINTSVSQSSDRVNGYAASSPVKYRSASYSTDNLHGSNEDVTRWRSASYSSEPRADHSISETSPKHFSAVDDSFINNCFSEEYLQQMLVKSTDFVERRKLRTRIRQLREVKGNLWDEGDGRKGKTDDKVRLQQGVKKGSTSPRDSLQLDYDKVETMEEFKTLLTVTEDHEEKRKIRNAMRQLRRRLEIEKVKLSAGGKVLKSDSGRRQSEDITLHRPSFTSLVDAKRRLSEDVSKPKVKNLLERKQENISKVELKSVPESRSEHPPVEVQFSARSTSNRPSSAGKLSEKKGLSSLENKSEKQDTVSSSLTASNLHKQKSSQSKSEDEDFLGKIKARLSTHEQSLVSSGRQQRTESLSSAKNQDSSIALAKSGGSVQSAKEGKVNTEKQVSASQKVKVEKADHTRLISDNKNEPTFKSSLAVKLNTINKGVDSKLLIGSKSSSETKKRILPDVGKLSKEKVNIKAGYKKPSQSERSSVFERLSQSKDSSKTHTSKAKDGIELELSKLDSVEVKPPLKGDAIPKTEVKGEYLPLSTPATAPFTAIATQTPTVTTTTTTSSIRTILSKPFTVSPAVGSEKLHPSVKSDSVVTTGVTLSTESASGDGKSDNLNKYVFRIDLKPKSKGLSRSHSDVLPQTRSWYKKSTAAECAPVTPLESRSAMEKAFLDLLDDMDHKSTTSDTKLSDVSDEDVDVNTNTGGIMCDDKIVTTRDLVLANGNIHMEQSKSWIVLRNVKEDLSAIKFADENDNSEEEMTSGQQDGQMDTEQMDTLSEDPLMSVPLYTADTETKNDEENNNVLQKVDEDVTDDLSYSNTGDNTSDEKTVALTPDSVSAPQVGESAITYQEEDDGTVTVQQVSQTENQDRVVTVRSKVYRTPSNAQAEERDTIVETNFTSPGGTQLKERDVIRTKKKITSRGSNYYQRSVHVTRRVKDKEGGEVVQQDLCVESDNKSVSQGESWGNRVVTKVTLDQPKHLKPMIEEAADVPKKSHATLVLNKLNVSKASSGYGSVSGSEEEDREEIVDIKQARPKGCPEITSALQDMVVREGEAVVMECGAVADPMPSVTWYLGYEQIDSDDDNYHVDHDSVTGKSSLTIHSTRESGHYRCVFKNQHGEAETKTAITVQKKPEKAPIILVDLHDLNVTEGHSITLTCTVTDAETIAWYKDGFVQRHSADFKQSYDGDVARLEIGEVFLDDVGEYACVARNELGEDRTACQITVTACDSETAVVPMFLTQLTTTTLAVGDKLVLECDVIGSPEPDINWIKDGQPIRENCSFNQMYDGRTAKLEINDVEIQDSGKYGCVAVNEAGRVSSDANVTVRVRNKCPVVGLPLSDVSSKAGENTVLVCHISGFPQPTIIWRKNGMLIGQTRDFKQHYDGNAAKLEICGTCSQDSGRYECVAKNGVGETSTSCLLTVTDTSRPAEQSAPEPPSQGGISVTRTAKPPQSIIGLALTRSASQKSARGPLLISDSPSSPTAAQSIISKALVRSASHTSGTDSTISPVASPSSSLPSDIIGRALFRSASQKVTSSSSRISYSPQSIIGKALETSTVKPPSPSQDRSSPVPSSVHSPSKPDSPSAQTDSSIAASVPRTSIPVTQPIAVSPARAAPQNTIGKFLALAASKDLEQTSSVPLRTTLDSPVESSSTPVTPTQTPNRDITQDAAVKQVKPTQHLSKVQQLRLQFLGEGNQSQPTKSGSAPLRRWHSLPPQDLRPTVVKREKYQEPGSGQWAIMPSYDNVNDEEELMKIMGKTDDFDERRKIRARLKELREKDKTAHEERRKQYEKDMGGSDVTKMKFQKAEEDKKRHMQQFKEMAVKPETKTETKTGEDGSKITTTTTTSSSTGKSDDGGTRTQTVKKTETTVTKTSGIGGVQYTKPGAEETVRKLSDHLQTASPPGTSGRISVKSESWNSRDGLVQKSEKTETWGAKPAGARGAMAAFKKLDATNSPAQPNALVTVSLAKKAATTMRRNAIAVKQEVLSFCQHNTQEYQTIEITNFSTCWNNGMAFCALIHHFFPDAFDFKALNPKQRRKNFDLAFDTAEKMADIAPLLDTEDMVKMMKPDWKCVFTYVQSIYRHLRDHDENKAKAQEQ